MKTAAVLLVLAILVAGAVMGLRLQDRLERATPTAVVR